MQAWAASKLPVGHPHTRVISEEPSHILQTEPTFVRGLRLLVQRE
jgi:hypothetical protein